MNDMELLELAAKAAGELYTERAPEGGIYLANGEHWNPRDDDGDALRLAVKLGIAILPYPIYAKPKHSVVAKQYNFPAFLREYDKDINISEIEMFNDDPYAATRRAIVRAAAEIGKGMNENK